MSDLRSRTRTYTISSMRGFDFLLQLYYRTYALSGNHLSVGLSLTTSRRIFDCFQIFLFFYLEQYVFQMTSSMWITFILYNILYQLGISN